MPDQRPDRCETCRYFVKCLDLGGCSDGVTEGHCHRLPPPFKPVRARPASIFWCGEWQAKPGEPTDGDTVR